MTASTTDQLLQVGSGNRRRWPGILRAVMPVLGLLILLVATTLIERIHEGTSDFLTAGNLLSVARAQAPMGIVAIGMTLVIIGGGIDLSVGSIVAMAAVCGLFVMNGIANDTLAAVAGFGVACVVGIAAGMVNGSLVAWGRVAPFIATLGGLAAYRSIARTVFNGTLPSTRPPVPPGVTPLPRSFHDLYRHGITLRFLHDGDSYAILHWPTVIFVVVAVAGWVLLNKTRYGRYVVAIGGNERAAVYSAVPVNRVKVVTYALAGLCCAIAAVLSAAAGDSVSTGEFGVLFELDAIAAVVVGGTLIAGGSGTIFGTVIGVLILGTVNNMTTYLSIPNTLQGVVKGAIIVAAATVQQLGKRK